MNKESPNYKWYVLIVLTLVYMFNFIDRQVIVILQESIKADLELSDTQLGLMTGLAFAALYVVIGIPIARLADRSNRKNILTFSLLFWSSMTVLSGRAMNFFQLLLARIGVGVGEAGCTPPAHSIISDYFPPQKRATAISIYTTGIYLGILMGFVVGGLLAKNYGWRIALYVLGIAGMLFSLVVYFTVKEPIKGQQDHENEAQQKDISLKEGLRILMANQTFRYLSLAMGFQAFYSYGLNNFLPAFLQRVHQMELIDISIILGLAIGLGGGLGAFFSGILADRLRHKSLRWYLWIPMLSCFVNIFPSLLFFFSNESSVVITAIFFVGFLSPMYIAPSIAVSLSLVNAKMRAFTSAIVIFVLNFIGLGFGPLIVGVISDALIPQYGDLSLRWAFCVTLIPVLISVGLFYKASTYYEDDMK
ncbi:MAG: spinster family MFS transporter [Chitinophagales bacterium]